MEFSPETDFQEAGLALVQDDRFHYLMTMRKKQGKTFLQLWETRNGIRSLKKEQEIKESSAFISVYRDIPIRILFTTDMRNRKCFLWSSAQMVCF